MITVASFNGALIHNLSKQHSIANSSPGWWKGPTLERLTPGNIVWALKKKQITQSDYIYTYTQKLKKLDQYGFDWSSLEGKTLLCWEAAGQFCHRLLLAEFLIAKGFEVTTY